MPSNVGISLPHGNLLEITSNTSNGDTETSGWIKATGESSVVGYFIADNGGPAAADATLKIKQSIDKEEVDITNSVAPSPEGNADPFEFDLVGNWAKADFESNEDISNVRLIVYRSTRVSPIN